VEHRPTWRPLPGQQSPIQYSPIFLRLHPHCNGPPNSQKHALCLELDPFYGHEDTARLCARFIHHLHDDECAESATDCEAKLSHFIASALHRAKLPPSVIFAALLLLQCQTTHTLTASGHRLFISALMAAVKVTCDRSYCSGSWSIVAQGMFTPWEIKQMEREIWSHLDPDLRIDVDVLDGFEKSVKLHFGYPTTTSAAPVFGYCHCPAHPRRPRPAVMPSCIHDKLEKGKRRCSSILGRTHFQKCFLITLHRDFRGADEQTVFSRSTLNHIGRDQHNHQIGGDQYNVVINPTWLNIVYPSESRLGNTGLLVCVPCLPS
jgi:hypothetical protein